MARLARAVVPGLPHHITQRGNRRQETFFGEGDYALYRSLMVEYIERNPLRAGLVRRAEDWPWSSAAAHVRGRDDGWVRVGPLLERTAGWACTWRQWLRKDEDAAVRDRLQLHERTGRPMGDEAFLRRLERILGRPLSPGKPGRPPKEPKT